MREIYVDGVRYVPEWYAKSYLGKLPNGEVVHRRDIIWDTRYEHKNIVVDYICADRKGNPVLVVGQDKRTIKAKHAALNRPNHEETT